jgi:hypothetical protein
LYAFFTAEAEALPIIRCERLCTITTATQCNPEHSVEYLLKRYAASRKVVSSRSDEMNAFSSLYLILPATLGLEVYSASNINQYGKQKIMFLESRAIPVLKANNLTAIREPFV